ncbi:putative membrane protein YuaF [Caloramator mitchellensis]|uniref:Putative membrane protein YuaF n=1 Tax=Caloramator mitchellensis TaxID=908809 RepID=A0A0R3K0P9_CALMK|nr:NfeD family protein [Caloramator mitchellensis]KRQ86434.1 putative membrane protein YuaF [Caloramator mitchellensis]
MLTLFKTCFYTGALLAFIMFLFGQVLDIGDFDGLDIDYEIPFLSFLPLKPNLIILFITVFGGLGLILYRLNLGSTITLMFSLLVAIFATLAFNSFILKPLYRAQNTSAVSQKDLIGKVAKVKIPIRKEGVGQIIYSIKGNRYTAPAKTFDGQELEKDEKVIIVSIDNNIFYVQK